ncbi:MAG: nucleoid-associated protein [Symbiopectobacterium sp.]
MARIDLTECETNPESQRYLAFLKGRIGRNFADFFMNLLSTSASLIPKRRLAALLQAVHDYCADAQLDKNEGQQYRQQVYSYYNEQLKARGRIEVAALSQELPALGEKTFHAFSEEQDYELEESFPVDRRTLR